MSEFNQHEYKIKDVNQKKIDPDLWSYCLSSLGHIKVVGVLKHLFEKGCSTALGCSWKHSLKLHLVHAAGLLVSCNHLHLTSMVGNENESDFCPTSTLLQTKKPGIYLFLMLCIFFLQVWRNLEELHLTILARRRPFHIIQL